MQTLPQLSIGSTAKVRSLSAEGTIRRRLLDLGFTEGSKIKAIRRSALGDPTAYLVRGSLIALRVEEASLIGIKEINRVT